MSKINSEHRERLRRNYQPERTQLLFVGEAPPASGRFFYQADSGLYRAVRDAFAKALAPDMNRNFLRMFQAKGCYLVDLCGAPVDHLASQARKKARFEGEVRLARIVRDLRPRIIVTVVKSIGPHVQHAQQQAGWTGRSIEAPYPGRWIIHRKEFFRILIPVLRKFFVKENSKTVTDL